MQLDNLADLANSMIFPSIQPELISPSGHAVANRRCAIEWSVAYDCRCGLCGPSANRFKVRVDKVAATHAQCSRPEASSAAVLRSRKGVANHQRALFAWVEPRAEVIRHVVASDTGAASSPSHAQHSSAIPSRDLFEPCATTEETQEARRRASRRQR